MAKLIMCKGLPGSGKSTWAFEMCTEGTKVVRVCKDDIRASLAEPWSFELEKEVLKIRDELILDNLKGETTVISDDTNLASKHQTRLEDLARQCRATFEVKDFTNVTVSECIARDARREGKARVGADVIHAMAAQFLPTSADPYEVDHDLPWAVICDLDGTLAIHNGRGPFEYDKCDTDMLNTSVETVIAAMQNYDHNIIFMSGRDESARAKTEKWLFDRGWDDCPLYMRPAGDYRKDFIVKLELFNKHIRGKFNVAFCLDDRDQVVKLWRDLGLACFQVNYGAF